MAICLSGKFHSKIMGLNFKAKQNKTKTKEKQSRATPLSFSYPKSLPTSPVATHAPTALV